MNKLYKHKFLPQNYIAEETLIGIILIYPNILNTIKNIIDAEYFFLERNKILYLNLINTTDTCEQNIIKLIYTLESQKLLYHVGGIKKITQMMKQGQIFICSYKVYNYIEHLIKLLQNSYLRRLIIQFGYNLIKTGNIDSIDNKQIYKKTTSYISYIEKQITRNSTKQILNIKDLVSQKLIKIKHQTTYSNKQATNVNIKSGFTILDEIIYGLPTSNLIIIAGRPSIGKTSLAINIAYNTFFNQKINLLIFSLEMTSDEIFNKFLCIGSQININTETIKNLDTEQWSKINKICSKLLLNNIYINDHSNIDIQNIENTAKSVKKNKVLTY